MTDDLALWGATDDDEALMPPPDMRRIGERLFVRPRGMEPNKAMRLPLRVSPDVMRKMTEASPDGVVQVGVLLIEVGDEFTQSAWEALDLIDQSAVARRFFEAERELLAGVTPGESSR